LPLQLLILFIVYTDFRACEAAREAKKRDQERLNRDKNKLSDARDQLQWDKAHNAPWSVIEADRDRLNRDKNKIDRDRGNISSDKARECAVSFPKPRYVSTLRFDGHVSNYYSFCYGY
jgi:hypothetical protein